MAERTSGMNQEHERVQSPTRTSDTRDQDTQLPERTHEVGRQAREWAQDTGHKLQEGAQEARRQAGEAASQLSEIGREAMDELGETLEDRIRQKPLQSMLMAAGVGLLVGLLWKR